MKITDDDHDRYISTQEFIQLTLENLFARLAKANLNQQAKMILVLS